MMRTPLLRLVVAAALLGLPGILTAQQKGGVYTAVVDGIIHPVAADYVRQVIEKADAANAALVVITLRTPGGLVDSTWNRAASAGFLITMASDIAAMAPGTHIGAAHPVAGNGEKIDDTMAK